MQTKIYILLISVFGLFGPLVAQSDSTALAILKEKAKEDEGGNIDTRWLVMDLGTALYLESGRLPKNDPFQLKPGHSINWNVYLFQQRADLYKHKINLLYGLGISVYSYRFEGVTKLVAGQAHLSLDTHPDGLKKNKLRTSFLTVPMMLNFKLKSPKMKRYMQFSVGGYGEILLASATKTKGEAGKQTTRDDFNLNKFRYGLRTEIGLGGLHLYLSYSLKSLFKQGEDPALCPLNFGVKIIPF